MMRQLEGLEFDVMLEAKAKDLALLRLRSDLARIAPDVAARFGISATVAPSQAEEITATDRELRIIARHLASAIPTDKEWMIRADRSAHRRAFRHFELICARWRAVSRASLERNFRTGAPKARLPISPTATPEELGSASTL